MLLLGHIGITLGAIRFLAGVIERISRNATADKSGPASASSIDEKVTGSVSDNEASWLTSLANNKDTKSLIIGSLLPDIIDKPVGLGICKDRFSNGRIFSHTLIFPTVLANIGCLIHRHYGKTWGFSLALGAFAHLILDRMSCEPSTLFWPLLGHRFRRVDTSNWLLNILRGLFTDPAMYRPEIIGAVMLLWFKSRR